MAAPIVVDPALLEKNSDELEEMLRLARAQTHSQNEQARLRFESNVAGRRNNRGRRRAAHRQVLMLRLATESAKTRRIKVRRREKKEVEPQRNPYPNPRRTRRRSRIWKKGSRELVPPSISRWW